MSSLPNPYVGPRAYEENETLYGREREIRQLKALLIAERVILLHSPSGAGKTSLIQAGLLPRMADEAFHILPIVRLNLNPPEELTGANRYGISALLSLEEPLDIAQRIPLPELADMTLEDYLERRYRPENSSPNELIVFDQFEEILTIAPADREGKLAFFEQLGAALRSRSRWALFSMREDYVAALAPYLRPLPKRLSSTFRLDLLGKDAAREAIQKPAQSAGIDFTSPAAEKLVEDLSRIQVQNPDGKMESQPGLTVEPVQLQVVCYRLWQTLPNDDHEIGVDDVSAQGSVDDSLADYYATTVARVAREIIVHERDIRDWFDKKLITPEGLRGQVLKRAGASDGLDNRAIDQLENAHVIRSEKRAGSTWYELSHDRLIDPIRKNNAVWSKLNLKLFQRQAKLWAEEGRPDGLLLIGLDLWQAEAESSGDFGLTADERAFLKDSQDAQKRADRDLKRTRLITTLAIGASVALLVVLSALVVAMRLYQRATAAEKAAVEEQVIAVQSANNAAVAEQVAKLQASNAATNAAEAQKQKALAEEKAKHARAGELIALSNDQRDHKLSLSLLLGIEAYKIENTVHTRALLLKNNQTQMHLLGFLYGHTDTVISVAHSPNGKILASGSVDKTIILWDMDKNLPIGQPLTGHTGMVEEVSFSPNGKILASRSRDETIRLWDVSTHQQVGKLFQADTGILDSIAFSPDGEFLVSGSTQNIILWDVKKQEPINQIAHGARQVAFSPDGKIIATQDYDNKITIWDVTNLQPLGHPLIQPSNIPLHVIPGGFAFSPDGKILASGIMDNKIILWDIATFQQIGQPLSGHTDTVSTIAFSPDGKILASGSDDHSVILWDIAKRQPIGQPLIGHTGSVLSISFNPDGKTFATAGADGIILWDVAARRSLIGGTEINYSISIGPDGRILPSGSYGTTLNLQDIITHQAVVQPNPGHMSGVNSVAYSPDGKTFAICIGTGIILWDVPRHEVIGEPLYGHTALVRSVAFSPDGKMLVSGSEDKTIIIWDLTKRQPIGQPLVGHTATVNTLAFSPDGKTLASGSDDTTIILWDLDTNKPIGQPLTGHSERINTVLFSPDGKTLVSGSEDKSIILWNVATRQPIGTPLIGHANGVKSVDFSPDGKTLASQSIDTFILWDIANQQPIIEPVEGYPSANDEAGGGGSDNEANYAGVVSGIIFRWNVINPQSWPEDACQRAGRNLTQAEWKQFFPGESYRKTCAQWPDGQ